MAKTAFLPSLHGLRFPNAFVNVLVIPPFGAITTGGRCGGMASRIAGLLQSSSSCPELYRPVADGSWRQRYSSFSSSNGVPPDGTILADFILLRLMTTFAQYGYTALMWNGASDHSTA